MSQNRNIKNNTDGANVFEESLGIIEEKIEVLSRFDWINCTDDELSTARKQVAMLKKLSVKILNSFYEG